MTKAELVYYLECNTGEKLTEVLRLMKWNVLVSVSQHFSISWKTPIKEKKSLGNPLL
jgi:hypothetical protein